MAAVILTYWPLIASSQLGAIVRNSVLRLCLGAIHLLILSLGSALYAADIDFRVSSGVGYDSNVFRSATEPKKDVRLKLAPKLALTLPFYKTYFAISSSSVLERYINRTDADLVELVFSGVGRYSLSDRISFSLQDNFIVSDRVRLAERLTDLPRRREFVSNDLSSNFRHELREDILTLSLGYTNRIRDYLDSEEDDWDSHSGQLRVEYSIGYKTSAQLSLGLVAKSYQVDVDYFSVPITVSLRRKLSNKLDAGFSLGLENRRYDEPYEDRNWDEPNISLNITGRFTPKTVSSLKLQRRVHDSDLAVGNTLVSKAGTIALALNLSRSAQLLLEGLYSRNDYMRSPWTSSVYEGNVTLQYRLVKWGGIAIGYGYEKWISTFLEILGFDYDKHVLDLSYVIIF